MANFTGAVYSKALQMKTNITVVTPRDILDVPKNGSVVYLLHGIFDNSYDWEQKAQLALLCDRYNLTFILPEVQRSFYIDMAYGLPYFTYISEELPQICSRLFNIPTDREHTYVMGLSMGGYGALKCALKKPEQYAGCAAFSAAADLTGVMKAAESSSSIIEQNEIKAILGMNYELFEENDLFRIAKACDQSRIKPRIFMTCGTEDFIYDMSVKFRECMKNLSFDFTYQEWSGVHEWYLWNKSLHLACAHFFSPIVSTDYCNIQ
jgi:putative tributyrin esterase